MTAITFDYPIWFIFLCLLLGAAYAFTLYFHDKTFKNAVERSHLLTWGLGTLRFLLVSIIAFLLLSPLLKSTSTEEEKPIIVVAQDNSASIALGMNATDSVTYVEQMQNFISRLRNNYRVQVYSFGEELEEEQEWQFNRMATDISSVLGELNNLYINQNVGAVILASDGIYNQGSNPLYYPNNINAPIYTVALGDTIPRQDIKIARVFHNKIAYLGDKFTVEVDIEALNFNGNSTTLTVTQIGRQQSRTVFQERINIDQRDYSRSVNMVLDANTVGLQHYRLSLAPLDGEVTTENNYQDIFIEVLDARQKILILAHGPHPDISALKQAIENNKNYELETAMAGEFNKNLDQYNLVVLHQLPSMQYPITNILNQLKDQNIPTLYVVGKQTSIPAFNQAQKTYTFNSNRNIYNEVQPVLNKSFTAFKLPENISNIVEKFPPLIVPFGNVSINTGANVLLQQKIGAVATSDPLFVFDQTLNNRTGVIAGEGMWRWRLYNYLMAKNHDAFDELASKMVQYLAVKADKRRFRITLAKNIFNENEQVLMDAELYNESYELINDPEVSVTITNEEGQDFPFTFNKTDNAYTLNAGYFPVGSYTFAAATVLNGKRYTYEGQFSVSPVKLEALQTTADHNLLYQLSDQTGGNIYFADQLAQLEEDIRNAGNIRPVLHDTERTKSMINLKWLFFLILGLLAGEWFVRKYNGAY